MFNVCGDLFFISVLMQQSCHLYYFIMGDAIFFLLIHCQQRNSFKFFKDFINKIRQAECNVKCKIVLKIYLFSFYLQLYSQQREFGSLNFLCVVFAFIASRFFVCLFLGFVIKARANISTSSTCLVVFSCSYFRDVTCAIVVTCVCYCYFQLVLFRMFCCIIYTPPLLLCTMGSDCKNNN